MIKSALLAWILTFSCAAQACTCAFAPLDTESARNAKDVFIFRLTQAKVKLNSDDERTGTEIIGQIKTIERLRGAKKLPEKIKFATGACCGTRLDVGEYFVAFVSDVGSQFVANSGNVMEVGGKYRLSDTRERILAVLDGKERLEDVFSRADRDRTEQSPVLPPCPRKALINSPNPAPSPSHTGA